MSITKVVYLAHKVRDPRGIWFQHYNYRAAEDMALKLWQMGAAVICPGKNNEYFGGAVPDEVLLVGDLALLNRCDAIVLAPDWKNSQGAIGELAFADQNGIPAFFWDRDLEKLQLFLNE